MSLGSTVLGFIIAAVSVVLLITAGLGVGVSVLIGFAAGACATLLLVLWALYRMSKDELDQTKAAHNHDDTGAADHRQVSQTH